jgi:hypothetical protein
MHPKMFIGYGCAFGWPKRGSAQHNLEGETEVPYLVKKVEQYIPKRAKAAAGGGACQRPENHQRPEIALFRPPYRRRERCFISYNLAIYT